MEIATSFSVIVLAALTHATLQLGLGGLLLLYHASLGKHIRKRTKSLASSYVAGVGMLVFLMLAAICFIIDRLFDQSLTEFWLSVLVAVLLSLAMVVWGFYYRLGKNTELWLPRVIAKFIDSRAKVTNSNTEAFSLGALTGFAEMPFSLVLMVVAANNVLALSFLHQLLGIALYTIIVIMPFVVLRVTIRNGQTVVDIQKWRVKNKIFFRILSGVSFAVLALFILAFEVMG